jgi:3-isopropylmalate dehydratase small subunit
MTPVTTIEGRAYPFGRKNVDTDVIIPAKWLKTITRAGLAKGAFETVRAEGGNVFDDPAYAGAPVLIAGDNFGCGSSREHAAMSPRFLGCAAVIVRSFARIHETNLKKQGILPLTFSDPGDWEKIREGDTIALEYLQELDPVRSINALIKHTDGSQEVITLSHTMNLEQIGWFYAGGALNLLKKKAGTTAAK